MVPFKITVGVSRIILKLKCVTEPGTVDNLYIRSQIYPCSEIFLDLNKIPDAKCSPPK